MRVLVFDTETTGLMPKEFNYEQANVDNMPHIIQFSYVIYDTDENKITDVNDYIIKLPDNAVIPEDSIKFHGITREISSKKGDLIELVIGEFFHNLKYIDKIVGHNIAFDVNMLKIELKRITTNNRFSLDDEDMQFYRDCLKKLDICQDLFHCTLKENINFCNISAVTKSGKPYIKFPKLAELHHKLFNNIPDNLHNSLTDVLITLRCYVKINLDRDLKECCESFNNIIQLN